MRRDAAMRDAPYSTQASVAKLIATDAAMKVTTDAVQVFGGVGYTRDYRVERYMREAKIMQIFEGTNQIQRLVIARALTANSLLGRYSRSLRRIASATAAARSPTPSFSYSRCTWVFTVDGARYSCDAIAGMRQPVGDQLEHLPLARAERRPCRFGAAADLACQPCRQSR